MEDEYTNDFIYEPKNILVAYKYRCANYLQIN